MKGGIIMSNETILLVEKNKGQINEILGYNEKKMTKGVKDSSHLCWNCQNGYPSKCEKIAALKKDNIASYDFIESGHQIIRDGRLEKFIVSSCHNYELSNHEPCSAAELSKAMDSLLTYFYNTETAEEALRTRQARRKQGHEIRLLKREKNYFRR